MRVSRSVVTTRIQQLEEFVGAPLFHRNTRSVRLSDLGSRSCRDCIELVVGQRVVDQMRGGHDLAGRAMRVHALPGFGARPPGALLKSSSRYRRSCSTSSSTTQCSIPVRRVSTARCRSSRRALEELISRKLFPVRRVLCASPHPRACRRAAPPARIAGAPPRLVLGAIRRASGLVFYGSAEQVALEVKPVMLTKQRALLREYALEHAGMFAFHASGRRGRAVGALQVVLQDYPLRLVLALGVLPDASAVRE